jgi:hypothetical protein
MMRGLAAVAFALLVAVSGCGGTASSHAARSSKSVVIAHGRTAAGSTFVAAMQIPTSSGGEAKGVGACHLNVSITEGAPSRTTNTCYSWSESPVRPKVECQAGTLTIHLPVRDKTHNVRLTLSDGRTVTSPVIRVPPALGGSARLYYQAVQGPRPIPVSITEFDGRGDEIRTVATPRVVECTKIQVRDVPGSAHVLASDRAPGGRSFTISSERTRTLGRTYFGLRVAFEGAGSNVIGSGPLRLALPLEWDVRRVCKPHPYGIIYGVLTMPGDEAFVRTGIGLERMRRVVIAASVRPHSTLVYSLVRQTPTELIVRTRNGKPVVDENVSSISAETPCV